MHYGHLIPGLHAYPFQFVSFLVLYEYPYAGIGGNVVVYLDGGIGRGRSVGRSGTWGKPISPGWPGRGRISEFWAFESMMGRGRIVWPGNFLPWGRGVRQGGRGSWATCAKEKTTGQARQIQAKNAILSHLIEIWIL